MHVTAIIAAAGAGRRLGAAKPKQLLDIGGGSMLQHSVRAFLGHPRVADVVVVLSPDLTTLALAGIEPSRAAALRVVKGGDRRQDSVANGFAAVAPESDVVLIHDAARPFVSADLIDRTIDAAAAHGAAIAALQSRDTVKRVAGDGRITETIPRETIYLAQTPQAFRRDVLAAAIELGRSGVEATDEAMLAERAGYHVHVVDGDPGNVKVTTSADLDAARARMASTGKPARTGRAGTGYDLHRLVEGRPLILGGVTVPSDKGALGHSDADVVCHAATDAILGAVGLGDIGRHFPDTDPRWKNADSLVLLREAARMVRDHGYEVGNLDVTVILERPKIKDAVEPMRTRLAEALGIDRDRVSVKGKTNEGVDAVGRGEAVAAHAVALVRSR
ncbi:MAG TPA: 2-C-methyl-D-erythritol 4-phosphate cytidylyltransferase [Vicinamibacterales bacterium]|nr:2-C-methyl-D-erythritol 4-phosphate cytidylyltransferase [Vicinamibacterales bacterium]